MFCSKSDQEVQEGPFSVPFMVGVRVKLAGTGNEARWAIKLFDG